MRLGFYQFAPEFGEVEANVKHISAVLKSADAELIVFPELATSGYLFTSLEEVERAAEPVPGPSTEQLQDTARAKSCHLVVGLPELSKDGIFNSAILIGPDGVVGIYRKMHLFNEEKLYFKPGNLGFPLFEVAGVKVGLLVCFDHMFPEAARTLALQGVQIICHPSNLVLPEYGQLTARVRSIENRVFWILSNRCGLEERGAPCKKLRYTGLSQITAPDGRILAQAPESGEALLTVDIDPAQACNKHVTTFNDLFSDRRTEDYRM